MTIERLFTAGSVLPQDMVRMATRKGVSVPEDWSLEAAEALRDALVMKAPVKRRAIEENTMPSWLWQRRAEGPEVAAETSIMDVVDRIAGAATYRGWKLSLWKSEVEASTFFDEARALLLTRRLVFAPKDMARLGLAWAYGLEEKAVTTTHGTHQTTLILQNETVDTILGRAEPTARAKWNRFLEGSQNREVVHVAFADTMAEWSDHARPALAPRAMLNLLAFRHDDGSLDTKGLQQATRLAVLLLDLHYDSLTTAPDSSRQLMLGFANLAALLMSLGLAYDSKAGRSTAASLAALITTTATETSAKLAARLGPCSTYSSLRESVIRNLENQLRAAFGEKNDYDRLSVLPQTLDIASGVDLVLLSTVRYALEEVLRLVRKHGLRHAQLTGLYHDPSIAPLMDCSAQGIEAEPALLADYAIDEELFETRVHPALTMALSQMGYDRADIKAVRHHVAGYRTLVGAPAINHAVLREKGFDENALQRVEAYLSQARHLRLAFTPWVLGMAFCQETLKIPAKDLENVGFNLLGHLGFSAQEISIANAFCCGHGNVKGVLELDESVWPVFSTRDDLTPEAQIQMAAAVQSFMMGDVGLSLRVPAILGAEDRGRLLLLGWKQGLRGLTLRLDGPPLKRLQPEEKIMKRQTAGLAAKHAAAPGRKKAMATAPSPRAGKAKAPAKSVLLKPSGTKLGLKEKRS